MGGPDLILLDTHIWIWFNISPDKLPNAVARKFADGNQDFGISAITLWETVLLAEKGRLETALGPEDTARSWLKANPLPIFPVDSEVAFLTRSLRFVHADPADRFIAATAFQLDVPLATVDPHLRKLGWLKVI